ncbi:hypothetical protein NXV19_20860 [Bacteroides fragilis]|nr:hypothetical protein NXV19_20860 [Bacteroides fragilis]
MTHLLYFYSLSSLITTLLREQSVKESGSNCTAQKKIITLKEDTFRDLSVMAAKQGTNLKRLIESMLDKAADEYDGNESYRYLSENYPDGKVMLGKEEREEFIDWLGVVEK